MKKYKLIYIDPPWEYKDRCNDGKRGASHKYPVMNVRDIMRLPIESLAHPDGCVMYMWHVGSQPEEAKLLLKAWGFRLSTMKGFTWGKTYKKQTDKFCLGMGHSTRANSEDCLIAVKGKFPERLDASICQLILAPRLENSAKPPIIRERLEQMYGDVPRIEIFARGHIPGWDTWGNECDCSIELQPAKFLPAPEAVEPPPENQLNLIES